MTTYYIDPTVSGTGTGTLGDPFKSWASVTWTAGNTYLQKRGTVFDGSASRVTISQTGTAGSPITLGAYGTGDDPVLDGGGTRDIAIIGTNHAYITIEDFEFRRYTRAGPYFGATSDDSSIARNIILRRLWIHDIGPSGLNTAGAWWWGSDVLMEDCLIERIEDDGVWCDGANATFRRVTIRDVSYSGGGLGDCVQFGGKYCTGLLVEHCDWDHSFNTDKQVLVLAGSLETAATFTIRDNRFTGYASGAGLITLDVLTDAAGGCVFERNVLMGDSGLRWADADTDGRGVIARNNLFIGIGGAATNDKQAFYSVNGKSLNNTFVGWSRCVVVGGGEVKNNVFKDITDYDYDASNASNVVSNCWWNVDRHAPTAAGASDINTDPLLSPSYRPLPGSPLIGAGTYIAD